ncbi:MAG: hypothetical protein U9O90_03360 [Euryarchaeota archaeon]|nr:hypothetical protein [Euryarchaeota archaeon]
MIAKKAISIVAVLGIAIAIATVVVATDHEEVATFGSVSVLSADDFKTNGAGPVSGWYWLRDPNYRHSAKWTFSGVPTDTSDGFVYLRFNPLVTNKANGGSGYSTNVILYNQNGQRAVVHLYNLHPEFQEPENTEGWGYHASGSVKIPVNNIPASGELVIELKRLSPTITFAPHTEHVGVNKECCAIEWH